MPRSGLDDLLISLDVAVEAIAVCEVRRGFRLVYRPFEFMEVHYVLSGTLHLAIADREPIVCGSGGMVVIPPNFVQTITASPDPGIDPPGGPCRVQSVDGLQHYDSTGGDPADLRFACGVIHPDASGSFGVLDQVTSPISVDLSSIAGMREVFGLIVDETARSRIGGRAIAGALMKAALIATIRQFYEHPRAGTAMLGELQDRRLCRVVAAVTDRPAHPHSVASLAELAGMSRSAFASRFQECYGVTPMAFVTKAKLHRAADALRSTEASIKSVAADCGFASRSHFSRAFSAAYGADPTGYRQAMRDRDGRTGAGAA